MVLKVMGLWFVILGLVNFFLGFFPNLVPTPDQVQFGQVALALGVMLYAIGSVSAALDARRGRRRG